MLKNYSVAHEAVLVVFIIFKISYTFTYSWTSLYIEKSISKLLPYSKLYPSISADVEHFLLNEEKDLEITENFINLTETLHPFSDCFVHVTNFRNIDIAPLTFPLMFRSLQPALVVNPIISESDAYPDRNKGDEYLTWVASGIKYPRNGTSVAFNCSSHSTLLAVDIANDGSCTRMKLLKFAASTKSWACQAHVGLLPWRYLMTKADMYIGWGSDILYLNAFKYPRVWSFDEFSIKGPRNEFLWSSSKPTFHVFIVDNGLGEIQYFHLLQQFTRTGAGHDYEPFITNDIFLFAQFEPNHNQFTEPISVATIKLLRQCYDCIYLFGDDEHVVIDAMMNIDDWMATSWQSAVHLGQFHSDSMIYWNTFIPGVDYTAAFDRCVDQVKSKRGLHKDPDVSINGRFADVYVHLWRLIFRNYTMGRSDNFFCANGKEISIPGIFLGQIEVNSKFWLELELVHDGSHSSYPVYINDTRNSLKFVSCGKRNKGGLPFDELLAAFEMPVWFAIIGTTTAFGIIATRPGIRNRETSIVHACIRLFAILLANKDSFPASFIHSTRNRMLFSGFLLAAVVISNAYLNTNVYNLIRPRGWTVYKTVHELKKDGYTVYTRAEPRLIINHMFATANFTVVASDKHRLMYGYGGGIVSELYMMYKTIRWIKKRPRLLDLTQLHEKVPETIASTQGEVKSIDLVRNISVLRRIDAMIIDANENLLNATLSKCAHTALIQPYHKCIQIANSLRKHSNMEPGDVQIGREMYFDNVVAFKLKGNIPTALLTRMKAVGSGGLWAWWNEFLGKAGMANKEVDYPANYKAAAMDGNVLVVFTLLIAGIIFGVVAMILEFIYNWLNQCKYFT